MSGSVAWSTAPLWSLGVERREVVEPRDLGDRVVHYSIPSVDTHGLGQEESAELIKSAKLRLRGGEVLISKLNPRKSRVLIVRKSNLPIVSSTEFVGIEPSGRLDTRFLTYFFQTDSTRQHLDSQVQSVTRSHQRVSPEDIMHLEITFPPPEEQRRIADFLDAETARIDKVTALRQRQLNVLKEKAIRRVYDTVRGKDFVGGRRPSGLSWLGTIPSHWRMAAVSHYFEVELGKMLNQERAHGDHLRPYLRVANVQWGEIDTSELALMDFPPGEQERYRLQAGDLLVNEGGSWPGRAAVWGGEIDEIYYQKALHRIRPRGAELTWWLYFCLLVAERMKVFQIQGNSSTMTHLTREQLRPQRFPFPTVDEQEKSVEYLRDAEAKDRQIRDALSRQQRTLAERRQALITAAVTGEFDVSAASGRGIEE